jgi:hypothetical protein
MDFAEKLAREHLLHRGFRDIIYEPNGNAPPDFLCDGRVAVEVRRLNQHEETDEGHRGLEEIDIPLTKNVRKLLQSLGPPTTSGSWFIFFSFQRPLEKWRTLAPKVKRALECFRDSPQHEAIKIQVCENFELDVFKSSKIFDTFFVLGGNSDHDAGGWLLSEMERNIKICIREKTDKISKSRHKYPEWWLVLVDHIGYGLDTFDREMFREEVKIKHNWNKVILVDPRNHERAFEI